MRTEGVPIEWSEAILFTGEGSPYIGQVLDAAFGAAQAVVVLQTPDDVAYLPGPLYCLVCGAAFAIQGASHHS